MLQPTTKLSTVWLLFVWLLASTLSGSAYGQLTPLFERDERNTAPLLPPLPPNNQAGADIPQNVAQFHSPTSMVDRRVIELLEATGFDFPSLLLEPGHKVIDNSQLYQQSKIYSTIVKTLETELDAIKRSDSKLDIGMRTIHRLFDKRWLRSPSARFELVGIVNRADREPFNPRFCGETRLIYRLAYTQTQHNVLVSSRLPLTLNFVIWNQRPTGRDTSCKAISQLWQERNNVIPSDSEYPLGPWLAANGPLSLDRIAKRHRKSIEINMQSVRWPSTIRPDLGAHAEYLMRVFDFIEGGEAVRVGTLENTPNLGLLSQDQTERSKLLNWLKQPQQLQRLDEGTLVLPKVVLAKRAVSVSPRGYSRLQNRPFKQLYKEADFANINFAGYETIKSPAGVLRRLDDLTCMGCHQGRSVAGFHMLGEDRPDTLAENSLAIAASPHFFNDLPRRERWLKASAAGRPADPRRDYSESPATEMRVAAKASYGEACGLGDASFAHWQCKPGFECKGIGLAKDDNDVGRCFPVRPKVGDPCEYGEMIPHANGRKDRVKRVRGGSCASGHVCEVNQVGFPEGMCATSCDRIDQTGTCGAIALLTPFNQCLASRMPFSVCLRDNTRAAGLRRCNATTPCRDDYICSSTSGDDREAGACIPPYFLFQMRVDGHPRPR